MIIQTYTTNEYQSIITPEDTIFFDMDETLIETTGLNNYAYLEAFRKIMGYEYPGDTSDRITQQSVQGLPDIPKNKIDEIIAEKNKLYSAHISLAHPIMSTVEILDFYYRQNDIYLVTRAKEERAIETIQHFGLSNQFQGIISSNAENKYADAINRVGVDPDKIVVFENDENEIENGMKAGISANKIIKVSYGQIYNSSEWNIEAGN